MAEAPLSDSGGFEVLTHPETADNINREALANDGLVENRTTLNELIEVLSREYINNEMVHAMATTVNADDRQRFMQALIGNIVKENSEILPAEAAMRGSKMAEEIQELLEEMITNRLKDADAGEEEAAVVGEDVEIGEEDQFAAAKEEVNILFVGETGCGKTTMINGIANYLTFDTLDEALQARPVSLIGSKFTFMDENYQQVEIVTGHDDNENAKIGESSTQNVRTYEILVKDTIIRIIDTPGIGDTRGIEQDEKNMNNILKYLSTIDKLHGICILMKPKIERMTASVRFCLQQLITHLHRSAIKNLVFCFTNSRATFYKPEPDTMNILRKMLDENPATTEVPLSNNTCYCFDNEAFRYLWAVKQGIRFTNGEHMNYSASWDKSVTESRQLIGYLKTLVPHDARDTVSINNVRIMILQLTKPMVDISVNITRNMAQIEESKRELLRCKDTESELKKKLYLTSIELRPQKLEYPRTVCISPSCVEYNIIPHTNEQFIRYKTICHPICRQKDILPEKYPLEGLKNCWAMYCGESYLEKSSTGRWFRKLGHSIDKIFGSKIKCCMCDCSWKSHMHQTYIYEEFAIRVLDESIREQIDEKRSLKEQKEDIINSHNNRKQELLAERKFVSLAGAKFGRFLKENALAAYNDALGDYLKMLIAEEKKNYETTGNCKKLDRLKEVLADYMKDVDTLKKAMDNSSKETPTIEEIYQLKEGLLSLKHSGEQFRKILEVIIEADQAHADQFCKVRYNPKVKEGFKGAVQRGAVAIFNQIRNWANHKMDYPVSSNTTID